MMGLAWFVRMARWARHPPPADRVKLVIMVVALCIALVLVERFVGWPDWLTTNGNGRTLQF